MSMRVVTRHEFTPVCDTCGNSFPHNALNAEAAHKFALSAGWLVQSVNRFCCRKCQVLKNPPPIMESEE